ncbi:MAG: hypothetical protein R3304_11260 [Longimicrobiales bacterium]|nr:hypothetical protein [Longimicrobiales bacterium]
MSSVRRIGRVLDVVGLLVFLAGGGLVVRAWMGFQSVPAFEPTGADGPWAAMQLADGFHRTQRLGVALMVVGVAVFVLAWWMGRRGGPTPAAGSSGSSGPS